MDTFKKKDYGTKIEYDPLWEGPMKTNRTRTDAGFLVGFVTFLSLWIVVGAVVVSQGYVPASSSPNDPSFDFSLAISEHKSVIIGMIFMGIVLAVGYIVALRWFAKFIVWSAVVLMILLILAALIFTIKDLSRNASGSSYVGVGFQAIILIVIVVVAIVYRKKIKIACEVIREASKAHLTFASSFIILFIPAILYITSVGFFGVVALNARNLGLKNSGENDSTPFYIYAIHLFNFFGLLWSCSFVNGLTQMALAGAFGTWYWTHRKENIPRFTVLKSCKTVLVFHLGTVAFGSLVIAICQLIKSLFQALRSESGSSGNGFGRLMACWCGFVWENIEQFVKFMGRNAYVMSAIHGTGFFASAKDAFNLIMRNLVSTLILNNVIDAVLALGVLLVSGITAGVTYALVQKNVSQDSTLAAIIILVLIITLFFAVPIFMVLQVACDTIFLCVLEDYERHDDSETKPYYMSKRLKKLLLVDSEESI